MNQSPREQIRGALQRWQANPQLTEDDLIDALLGLMPDFTPLHELADHWHRTDPDDSLSEGWTSHFVEQLRDALPPQVKEDGQ